MTQIFDESGAVVPVTVLEAGPCPVIQRKTKDKDGYEAVQLGFDEIKDRKRAMTKPQRGHLKKHGVDTLLRKLHEFQVDDASAGKGLNVFGKGL